ncbi:MAG: hypothetical protein KDA28_10180, partial [Phycisphaerales bacterium]|nr:hypothetical protein [Phycisphaerales bacterium]
MKDESVLLCERCGYEIEGLALDTNCPECGLPVRTSLPQSRPGSPLQQGGAGATWRTTMALLKRPGRTMADLRIEPTERASKRMRRQFLLPGVLASLGVVLFVGIRDRSPSVMVSRLAELAGVLFGVTVAVVIVISILTHVEVVGVRFWGNRHGRRITKRIAINICAHAACGWSVGGLLIAVGLPLGELIEHVALESNVGILRGPFLLARYILPAAGFFTGMLLFEFWTWKGVQANR